VDIRRALGTPTSLLSFPPQGRRGGCSLDQYGPQRGDRRHEEIGSGGQNHELTRHMEGGSPIAGRVVRMWLVDLAHAFTRRPADKNQGED
jgi:hypothetical protein